MKYKVIEIDEITKEILESLLEEAYKDGYRDGYDEGKKCHISTFRDFPSSSPLSPPYILTCNTNTCLDGYQPKPITTNRAIIPPKGTKGEDA